MPSPARRILAITTRPSYGQGGAPHAAVGDATAPAAATASPANPANRCGTLPAVGVYDGVELSDLVLTGPRLTLRPWRAQDADAVHAAMQDRTLHEFLPLPDPYTAQDAHDYVTRFGDEGRAEGRGLGCALVETATGRVVGSAALRLPGPRRANAEVGYWVAGTGRGHGYAAEATRVLAGWAFEHGVPRVELLCAVRNLASIRTALAAGARFEGVLRGAVVTPAGTVDGAILARVAGDPGVRVAPVVTPLPAGGLDDGVLRLRVLSPADAAGLAEQEADPLTRRWEFTGEGRTARDHAQLCERAALEWLVGPVLRCAMVDVATDRFAGTINVRLQGPPHVGGVGYAVHPDFRGRGYTARALRLLRAWAFEQAGFARLELGAKQDNVASQRAAHAAGFLPDGVRAARLRNPDGTFSDEVRFAAVSPAVRPDAG